tara:strand:+ start:811 stop:1077 length:267 start_codon:yes stop_codon:yes gene_type:complete
MQPELDIFTGEEYALFYGSLRDKSPKDQIVLSACQSDIAVLRKVSRELDSLCVSTAWNSVNHIQTHIEELIADIHEIQDSILNPDEES